MPSLYSTVRFFHPISQYLSPFFLFCFPHGLLFMCQTTIRLTFLEFSSHHCGQKSCRAPSCTLETIWTPRPAILDSSQQGPNALSHCPALSPVIFLCLHVDCCAPGWTKWSSSLHINLHSNHPGNACSVRLQPFTSWPYISFCTFCG